MVILTRRKMMLKITLLNSNINSGLFISQV